MASRRNPRPTPPAAVETDERDALELSSAENADLCAGCARCCETVSIEVDAPRSAWEYDQWVWVLHHESLELYLEKPERWFLHIETRCSKLDAHNRCSIHGRHPILCREYDPRVCERRLPLSDVVAWFKDADQLEAWIRRTRPAHWRRLQAWRREKSEPAARPRRSPVVEALVRIAEPGQAGHEPATHLPERKAARRRR
ncbi:MAG: YkgJ family cysteine cluster protein [bacterium]